MNIYDWFQIVFLLLFYLVFIGRTVQLMLRGIRPLVLGVGKVGFRAVLELSFFIGLLVWTLELVAVALQWDWHLFPAVLHEPLVDIAWLRILGVGLILCGFLLFVWALGSFGDSWRVGIDRVSPGSLTERGAFAWSRNPIFVFLDLYFVGTCLIYPNPFFIGCALLILVGIHLQILQEERFLSAHYGDAYTRYRTRVRRYF